MNNIIYTFRTDYIGINFYDFLWHSPLFYVSLQHQICNGMMSEEERLVKILQLSHSQILAGKSYSQEEAERFLDQRLYEVRDKMVGTGVAEPC